MPRSNREQNIELRILRGFEQFAIFEPAKPGMLSSLAFMLSQMIPKAMRYEVRTHRGGPSFELANEGGLGVLQRVDGSLASDRGKILEKFI